MVLYLKYCSECDYFATERIIRSQACRFVIKPLSETSKIVTHLVEMLKGGCLTAQRLARS